MGIEKQSLQVQNENEVRDVEREEGEIDEGSTKVFLSRCLLCKNV